MRQSPAAAADFCMVSYDDVWFTLIYLTLGALFVYPLKQGMVCVTRATYSTLEAEAKVLATGRCFTRHHSVEPTNCIALQQRKRVALFWTKRAVTDYSIIHLPKSLPLSPQTESWRVYLNHLQIHNHHLLSHPSVAICEHRLHLSQIECESCHPDWCAAHCSLAHQVQLCLYPCHLWPDPVAW